MKRVYCSKGFSLKLFVCLWIALSQVNGAYELSASSKWYHEQVRIIHWLQNFTRGDWVNREDMTWVTQSNFGTQEMPEVYEAYMLGSTKHFDVPMLRALAVYLRSFKNESVARIWSELLMRAKDLNQHDAVFKVSLRETEASNPVEIKTSIHELAKLAKQANR